MSEELIDYYLYSQYALRRSTKVLTNLADYYNSQDLPNKIIFDDNGVIDDGARRHDVASWGCYMDYSGEGYIGLTFTDLPKKNSGYLFTRQYYVSSIEPDFQIVARIDSDMRMNSLKLKYNSSKLIGIVKYQLLSDLNLVYQVYFEFNKDIDGKLTIGDVFLENLGSGKPDQYSFLYGYKSYDRDAVSWSPNKNDRMFFGKNVCYDLLSDLVIYDLGKGYSKGNHDIGDMLMEPFTSNVISNVIHNNPITKPYDYKDSYSDWIMRSVYLTESNSHYDFFVEGVPDNDVEVTLIDVGNNYRYNYTLKNNFMKFESISDINYKVTHNNYYKIFHPKTSKRMVKGGMTGNIGFVSCEYTELLTFKVKCTRVTDDFLIGYYDVVDNMYNIPNLNYNELYDIILIDNSMNLEQKILSKRRPTLYNPLIPLTQIPYISVVKLDNMKAVIDWEIYGDYEETILYKSTTPFINTDLPLSPIYKSGIQPHHIDIDFVIGTPYYYMAAAKIDDVIVYSELKTITI